MPIKSIIIVKYLFGIKHLLGDITHNANIK